jgi:hypothetical protein
MSDHPPHQPLEYALPDDQEPDPADGGRGVGRWMQLLAVWIVGLGVWVIYIAVIVYVFFKFVA